MRQIIRRLAASAWAGSLCLCLFAGAASAQSIKPKENATDADIEQAKKHMAAGVAFLNDPNGKLYEEAYPEFKKAYRLSGSLNALQNLAVCAMQLELDGEAIEYLDIVLQKKGDELEESERAQLESDLTRLKATVATVTLSADKPGVKVTDVRTPRRGAPIRNTYAVGLAPLRLGIHPGSHKFTAISDDGSEKTWSIQIQNGSEHNHEFVFDPNAPVTAEGFTEDDMKGMDGTSPDPDDESGGGGGIPVAVWVTGGITVAAAIPMAVFMGLSASQKAEYDDEILGKAPLDEQQQAADDLKTTNLLADVFLGVTAAGAVTTLVLALVLPSGDDTEETGNAKNGPRFGVDYTIAPSVDPRGGAGAWMTARF